MKKGYALATTLAVMVIVFALSAIALAITLSMSNSAKNVSTALETKVEISQIAQNYIEMEKNDFVNYYLNLDYQKSEVDNVIVLTNSTNKYKFKITNNQPMEVFEIINISGKSVAKIEKNDLQIISWEYN